ncbi:MAG: hypothetical protein ACOYNG_04365 [Terrimicrobiaceae bacterium]|jgi:hypothetical protein
MSQPEKKPWLAVTDRYGDYDGGISGDKEGLTILKEAIVKAIETGGVIKLPDSVDADFESVRVAEICGRHVKPTRKDKLRDSGCLLVLAVIILVLVVGLMSLFKHGLPI